MFKHPWTLAELVGLVLVVVLLMVPRSGSAVDLPIGSSGKGISAIHVEIHVASLFTKGDPDEEIIEIDPEEIQVEIDSAPPEAGRLCLMAEDGHGDRFVCVKQVSPDTFQLIIDGAPDTSVASWKFVVEVIGDTDENHSRIVKALARGSYFIRVPGIFGKRLPMLRVVASTW